MTEQELASVKQQALLNEIQQQRDMALLRCGQYAMEAAAASALAKELMAKVEELQNTASAAAEPPKDAPA